MPTVSLCVIARNEAANLEACLRPLLPLVHETVVADTGSTDATRSIAEACGARVFNFPWCDDFAAARNETLRRATGDWILWMDADDRLDEENTRRLADLLAGLNDDKVAHLMSCVSLAADGQPSVETKHVRLFPSSPAHRWARRVHEQILPSLRASGCVMNDTGIAVHHVGYQEHGVFLGKIERNLRLLELEYESRPPDGWYFYQRGGGLFDLRRFPEAIVALNLAVALAAADVAPRIHALLAEAYAHEDQGLVDALRAVQAGRERYPSDPDLLLLEAQILSALGDQRSAEASLISALQSTPESGTFALVDATLGVRARHLLARVYLVERRHNEAEAVVREILRERPAFGPAVLTLGECLLAKGDIQAFDTLAGNIPEGPETATGRAVLAAMKATRAGDAESAVRLVDDALTRDAQSTFLAKARVFALLRCGHDEARPALDLLLRAQPLDLEARAASRASRVAGP